MTLPTSDSQHDPGPPGETQHEGRAWGKVILLGEHAVVYGVPALAAGIELGAHARASRRGEGPPRLHVEGWDLTVTVDDASHDLARGFRALLDAAKQVTGDVAAMRGLVVTVRSELPPGGGLGCSAALGVSIARAVMPNASEEAVREVAMAWEGVFHGNPSGVDVAVAQSGGCIVFERGRPPEPVRSRSALLFCVGSTGVASSTKTMVEGVARLRQRRPDVVQKTFDGIASLVRNARLAIEAGDRPALGRLLDLNQMLLSGLFVSTDEIEQMCELARSAGALGAKLTGAGGGGSVVALAPGRTVADAVLLAWKEKGFSGFAASVAGADPTAVWRPAERRP